LKPVKRGKLGGTVRPSDIFHGAEQIALFRSDGTKQRNIVNCTIVDFGMGNLRSIQHKLEGIGVKAVVSRDAGDVESADRLILPGVGHFAHGMENLRQSGLLDVLNHRVLQDKIPVLGICLGMQLFSGWSEEGEVKGLGWIEATTRRFEKSRMFVSCRIPHVGWNGIKAVGENGLLDGVADGQEFYFTHSYHVCCDNAANVVATTNYGYDFVSIVRRENIVGVQFHPEKSHEEGMIIVKNFLNQRGR